MNDIQILRRLFGEMRTFYGAFTAALVLYIPVTLLALSQPFIIGVAVERGFQTQNLNQITMWAVIFFAVVVLHAGFEMGQLYLMQWVGLNLVKRTRERLFAKIQQFSMAFLDHTPLGRILIRVTNDVESIAELFSSGAVAIFGDLFFLAGTLIMLFAVDVKLSLASIAVLPLLALGLVFMRKWMRQAYHWVRSSLARVNSYLQEYLSGMQTVQLFAQVHRVRERFDVINTEYMQANRRAIFLDATVFSFVDAISTATIAVVLLAGFGLREQGILPLGIMVTFIEALTRFFQPIRELSTKYTIFQSALVSGERIFELMDLPVEIISPEEPLPAKFNHMLAFEHVDFSYAKGATVLRDVSFRINKGERIALVGQTGAGKSTVAKLATRFYDVTGGSVTFDNIDIRRFKLNELRNLFNVVPQEVFLFSGTLRDNLRYGKDNATDEEILHALNLCQASYLLDVDKGLDAVVSARGLNFSLGERQLIALARALIADPQILILDEATAGVDPDTERRLQIATHQALKHRTSLIVAHRLSTIRDCDRILVFHKGALIEEGSHQALVDADGIYAKLVELQHRERELGLIERLSTSGANNEVSIAAK